MPSNIMDIPAVSRLVAIADAVYNGNLSVFRCHHGWSVTLGSGPAGAGASFEEAAEAAIDRHRQRHQEIG